eukprot:2407718-Amphidinium_carterae.1
MQRGALATSSRKHVAVRNLRPGKVDERQQLVTFVELVVVWLVCVCLGENSACTLQCSRGTEIVEGHAMLLVWWNMYAEVNGMYWWVVPRFSLTVALWLG